MFKKSLKQCSFLEKPFLIIIIIIIVIIITIIIIIIIRACLQGGRVTLASGLNLTARQKIARVYKQNFTGWVTLQPGRT